jgi:hypothetical protein
MAAKEENNYLPPKICRRAPLKVVVARDTGLSRHILLTHLPRVSEDYNIKKAKAFRLTVFDGRFDM